jgi:transglutaminase-like putative cysteine protease
MRRHVGSWLLVRVQTPSRIVLQITVADPDPGVLTEELTVGLNGTPIEPTVLSAPHGGRMHVIDAAPGDLAIAYSATITGRAAPAGAAVSDQIGYLRASRYAESDKLFALARAEFPGMVPGKALIEAVASWVAGRLFYLSGWSRPTDGAVETLLSGQGVCRDFTHVVVAVLRALDVPARTVAVYAPGLYPMDFHSVVEAFIDGHWQVVDATGLAPRSTLVRIATGRDAADTAFLSSYFGEISMIDQVVTAVVDGYLPTDDPEQLVELG